MPDDVRVRVERSPNRCPYCHDDVRLEDDAWLACATCLARHHADCWADPGGAGRCSGCGGDAALEPPPARRRPRLRVAPRGGAVADGTVGTRLEEEEPVYGGGPWVFAKLLVALGVGAAVYHALMRGGVGQTSALFVGLPALLAVLLVVTPAPRTTAGMTLKAIAFLMALAGLLFNEGLLCILMAAPIFLAVGLVVAKLIDWVGAEGTKRSRAAALPLALALVAASVEGTTPALSFERDEAVTVVRVVDGTAADVERRLAAPLRPDLGLPLALQLGFPRPVAARGAGLEPGDLRVVRFSGGEGRPGDLVLRVGAREPGRATFVAESDASHVPHYLAWRWSDVRWEAAGEARTTVRWTVAYTRRLDPAWYFAPCERWCVELAAGWLIDAVAGPAADQRGADERGAERRP